MCRISSIQAAPAYVSSCHRVIYTTSFLLIGQDFFDHFLAGCFSGIVSANRIGTVVAWLVAGC